MKKVSDKYLLQTWAQQILLSPLFNKGEGWYSWGEKHQRGVRVYGGRLPTNYIINDWDFCLFWIFYNQKLPFRLVLEVSDPYCYSSNISKEKEELMVLADKLQEDQNPLGVIISAWVLEIHEKYTNILCDVLKEEWEDKTKTCEFCYGYIPYVCNRCGDSGRELKTHDED